MKTISQLAKQFGIKPFSKSKPQADFAALGDDTGLFIVSKVSRNWLFTNIPAALTNYRVTFQLEPRSPVQTLIRNEQNLLTI